MNKDADVDGFMVGGTFQPGARIHGYVVERLLGKGGVGAVYLVRHEMLDRFFALKVLDPKMAEEKPEYVKRFVREARLASKIRHPNLVAVHDAGFDEGTDLYYLVMDYVQGSTLRQAIALGGAMDEQKAVSIVSQVASALQAARRFGVVHRDIKPENIMILPDDSIKLIDLGVAKATGDLDTFRTMDKTVFGTPSYMAPEQAVDASMVDTRADIYSLGIVFFEMLCGFTPYRGATSERVILELLSPKPIPDICKFNPHVSPKLSAVISLMCAKRVEDRLASPSALLEALVRLGYKIPSALAEYAPDEPSIDKPLSYNADVGSANNTLSFDTKDAEVQEFVGNLKRRRLMKRLAWCVGGAIATMIVALMLGLLLKG